MKNLRATVFTLTGDSGWRWRLPGSQPAALFRSFDGIPEWPDARWRTHRSLSPTTACPNKMRRPAPYPPRRDTSGPRVIQRLWIKKSASVFGIKITEVSHQRVTCIFLFIRIVNPGHPGMSFWFTTSGFSFFFLYVCCLCSKFCA